MFFLKHSRKRGVADIEEAVLALVNGYNLAANRNLRLYVALTCDEIQLQPFWQAFKESATRRNGIIHHGAIVGRSEAEASVAAAGEFVRHLARK